MNTSLFTSKILPVLTIILVLVFWKLPLGLNYFEMIIATIIICLSSFIEFKSKFLKKLGFHRKNFTIKNLLIKAPLIAIGLFILYFYILLPVITKITQQPIDYSGFNTIKNNPTLLIISLIFIWVSAAFGEEMVWRGYFMKQFVKFFGDGKLSIGINIILFGILFGFFHAYQGITGQIVTAILGAILGFIFYKNKYDLWFNIIVHGVFDSIALMGLYFGFL
ncbi:CPBP family intramembrane glutamic endopeptidase [Tenacibaculum agarivorans]|uniref:CPBP family intramembrane glutamic endopeptidase n=1 Tax=Tenacibaculum agarivorans TaxID=1908389 RepID=UPI00094BAAD7|nr:type II CAAX endopeptidase family protein [Tenacibaculum agarivorans]